MIHRLPEPRRLSALLLAVLLPFAAPALAQGSLADHERAAGLRERFEGLLLRHDADPEWLDGERLWYAVTVAPGRRELVRVDASAPAGRRREVLALESELAGRCGIEDGRVRRLAGGEGSELLLLVAGGDAGGVFAWDPGSGSLRTLDPLEAGSLALEEEGRRGRGGGESGLLLHNPGSEPLELFYLAGPEERRSYGVLEPGATRWQHTFAGHRWAAVAPDGTEVRSFRAGRRPGVVVLAPRGEQEAEGPAAASAPPLELFLREHDLWLRRADGEEVPLTTDGTEEDGYGGPLHWSPDGRHVVLLRTRRGDRREVHLIESAPRDQLQPRLHTMRYAKPGDAVDHPVPHLFRVQVGGEPALVRVPVDDAAFPNPYRLSRLEWDADGSRFTFLYDQRGHQVQRWIAVDAASGEVRVVIDESAETFVDYSQKTTLRRLASGEVLWTSERDGWNHLYRIDGRSGEVLAQVTRGEWVVRSLESVDEEARTAVLRVMGFINGEDPYHEHFVRVSLDTGELLRLTEADGTHAIEFSPDGRWYLDRYSRVDLAPVLELRRSADGALLARLEQADTGALEAAGWRPPRRYIAGGRDGMTEIWGIVHYPTNHDPAGSYPVIESIYAGPHGQHVPKEFRVHRKQAELAELGFVVVQVDGMGTNWRSKAFHDVAWRNIADAGFPDRIAWITALAGEDPSLDLSRVGIYGGSAGGQNAMRALIAHGDFYHAAVADCGCHDNRMDKIWWNEAWMGWPVDESWLESSNVEQAHRLQGSLFLIVGELDRNVDPASTMQVVDALVRADKDFDLLVVPGGGHGVAETPYGTRRRRDFFVRELLGREPRW